MLRLAFLLLACALSYAQSPLGTVTGIATDPTGAAVPNAKVTIRNLDTSVQHETSTNSSGVYSVPNLPPGNYKLTAEAPGFRVLDSDPFPLPAFRTVREDLPFKLASAATVDTFVSDVIATVVQTDTPQVSSFLTTKQVLELPTTLRSIFNNSGDSGLLFTMMPMTTPGAVQVGAGAASATPRAHPPRPNAPLYVIPTDFTHFAPPYT